jgi:hypothetical protein
MNKMNIGFNYVQKRKLPVGRKSGWKGDDKENYK